MNSQQVFMYCGMFLFIILCYPILTVFMAQKDERELQYFLESIKTSMITSIFGFGLIFIIHIGNELYYIPIQLIILLLDFQLIIFLVLYNMKLNTEKQYENFISNLNSKNLIWIRNFCITLTTIFAMLNYKNIFFIKYKLIFLIGAYIFFFLSCYFGCRVSYLKTKK